MGGEEIPFTTLALVFGGLQLHTTYGGHLFRKYIHNPDWIVGKGNRLRWWELAAVIIGFSIDDIGTAIGQQATEQPVLSYEANPFMVQIWDWLIASGFATTGTGAHRIIYIVFMVQLFINQYFGLMNSYGRLFYLFTAGLKVHAGYNWWSLQPNNFTVLDFLTFKSGKPHPERHGLAAYNAEVSRWTQALIDSIPESELRRRRLVEEPRLDSANWLTTYLPVLFGAV